MSILRTYERELAFGVPEVTMPTADLRAIFHAIYAAKLLVDHYPKFHHDPHFLNLHRALVKLDSDQNGIDDGTA